MMISSLSLNCRDILISQLERKVGQQEDSLEDLRRERDACMGKLHEASTRLTDMEAE